MVQETHEIRQQLENGGPHPSGSGGMRTREETTVTVVLSQEDREMFGGNAGEAKRFAMSVIVRMADVVGATELISIEQAHLDACALMSDSSLEFIEYIARHGGRVCVPTTLNMVSLDLRFWKRLGVPDAFGEQATKIADAYCRIGAVPTWTCAPYQTYLTPRFGQQIAWGESNAVAYANSVLGARTNRYGDYMDVCAAITGRVPNYGFHLDDPRAGEILVRIAGIPPGLWQHPTVWAALGHWLGKVAGSSVPVLEGLPSIVESDSLKALCAAAASSGAVGLIHIVGVTPEAPDVETAFHGNHPQQTIDLSWGELRNAWEDLSSASTGEPVDVVIVGCPHYSYHEFSALVEAMEALEGKRVAPGVQFLVISNAPMVSLAKRSGWIKRMEAFGATLVFDTCPFHSPIVRAGTRTIVTNSGKCAYYAPGELGVSVSFATILDCVRSAAAGEVVREGMTWEA